MGTARFAAGAIVEIGAKRFELKRKVDRDLWQLEDTRTKRIVEFKDAKLRALYLDQELLFAAANDERSPRPKRPLAGICDDNHWEQAKLRRHYLSGTEHLPGTSKVLTPAIQGIWERLGAPAICPSARTVLRWRKSYSQKANDLTSLINRDHAKGNRFSRYGQKIIEIARAAIDAVYLTNERKTLQDTLDHAQHLTNKENELRIQSEQLKIPTRRLMERLVREIPAEERIAARYGSLAGRKRMRTVNGHIQVNAPLDRAEIDHSRLDVMVIDDKSCLPLGRPWLTVCIDAFSRCILGVFISFQPPSYLSVARCLRHAFLPKSSLKDDYPETVNTWDAHGVMRVLVVDNGAEFHSASFENMCGTMGIDVLLAPRKTPWFKPHVERVQGTMNRAVAHGVPGTTFANIFEKDDYDPIKHSVVKYSTLRKSLMVWITDVYHQKDHRTLEVSPAVMWENSIAPEDILLPDDLTQLDAIMGSSQTRVLSHKGIEFERLLYNSPELNEVRLRYGEKLTVDVRFDEADLGSLIVLPPDNGAPIRVPALRSDYADGLSLWQHRIVRRYALAQRSGRSAKGWLEAKALIAQFIQDDILQMKKKSRTRVARYTDTEIAPKTATAVTATAAATAVEDSLVVVATVTPEASTNPMETASGATDARTEVPQPDTALNYPVPTTSRKRFVPEVRERAEAMSSVELDEEE